MWPLIDQLVQQGVEQFFLAPGSRNTPLVLAVSNHPKAILHTHFDERGLGFYALGCALATAKPVAIIVTSGTAVGNLLPAVMEAHHSSIPLILLTADRPCELRDTAANQTTDQLKIFQNFVRFQCDLDISIPQPAVRSKAAQSVYRSLHPHPGPVHINCPAREPFFPHHCDWLQGSPIALEAAISSVCLPKELPSQGIILLGRTTESKIALQLAKELGWPVFADILSQARLEESECQIRHFDWLLHEAPAPACILHIGERLTSKKLLEWLTANPPSQYWHISANAHWQDPSHLITGRIHAHLADTHFVNQIDPHWLPRWKTLDRQIDSKLSPNSALFTETTVFQLLSQQRLEEWAIFLANSMPIREADWFLFPKLAKGFFANRGLSGIDGNIATIAGISRGLQAPVLAVIGDLTALHDLNSLALLKHRPIVLVISNNQGGGIFSHLPVANEPHFETLWAFSHPHSFAHAAQLFDIPYTLVDDAETWQAAISTALQHKTAQIIDNKTCRHTNAANHKLLRQQVKEAAIC